MEETVRGNGGQINLERRLDELPAVAGSRLAMAALAGAGVVEVRGQRVEMVNPAPWAGRSKRAIELVLPYPPSGNHSTRHVRGGAHYKTGETIAYRAAVAREVGRVGLGHGSGHSALPGPLAVTWLVLPPDARGRDVDNLRKEAADALTAAGLWANDSNRVIRRETFEWGPVLPGGRIELTIEVLG